MTPWRRLPEMTAKPHHHYSPIVVDDVPVHTDHPCTDSRCPAWAVEMWPTAEVGE